MSHPRNICLSLGIGLAASGCASLPRISTSHTCNGGAPSQLLVRAVDKAGKDVSFARVYVVSDDRATRLTTATSSAGSAKLPLQPGSYQVTVGENGSDWQEAARTFTLQPGCTVTARAELIPYEIDPVDTPLSRRFGR